MDNFNPITRRNLLRGAAPTTAAAIMAGIPVALAAGEPSPENLMELARRFADDAKRIDPSIIGSFVGTDMLPGDGFGSVNGVFLSRRAIGAERHKSKRRPSATERAINAHKAAWERFSDTVNGADTVHPDYRGAAGHEAWERAERAESRALSHLLRLPCDGEQARVRARYLHRAVSNGLVQFSEANVLALLRSMAGVL